jgi:transposase
MPIVDRYGKIEEWFMIRDLHAQGLNITEISNKTGYDRKTVKKDI